MRVATLLFIMAALDFAIASTVCEVGCDYDNITDAILSENSSTEAIYINSGSNWEITNSSVFHIDGTAIVLNSSDIALDCGGARIVGNGSGYGILISGVSNISVSSCNISNFSSGIYLSGVSDSVKIEEDYVYDSDYGINVQSSSNAIINKTRLESNSIYSILLNDAFENRIYDSEIISSGVWDIRSSSAGKNYIINSTFERSLLSFFDNASLTAIWYLGVFVNSSEAAIGTGMNISIFDSNDESVYNGNIDPSGYAYLNITDYRVNYTEDRHFNNHTILVENETHYVVRSINISRSLILNLTASPGGAIIANCTGSKPRVGEDWEVYVPTICLAEDIVLTEDKNITTHAPLLMMVSNISLALSANGSASITLGDYLFMNHSILNSTDGKRFILVGNETQIYSIDSNFSCMGYSSLKKGIYAGIGSFFMGSLFEDSYNGLNIISNSTIVNCTFKDNDNHGLYIGYEWNYVVNSNFSKNVNEGIYIDSGNNNSILSCVLWNNTGSGMILDGSIFNWIFNATIIDNQWSGIDFQGGSENNLLEYSSINSSLAFYGIGIDSSDNNTIIGLDIRGHAGDAIYVVSSFGNLITDSNLTSSTSDDIQTMTSGMTNFLNTIMLDKNIGAGSGINVSWTVGIHVNNSQGNGLEDANVTAEYGSMAHSGLTSFDGTVSFNITEYTMSGSTETRYGNYTLTAWKEGYVKGEASANITSQGMINIELANQTGTLPEWSEFPGSTDLLSEGDLENIIDPVIANTLGGINLSGTLNLSGLDLDGNIEISARHVYINTTELPGLNVTATLYLNNINCPVERIYVSAQGTSQGIYSDGEDCEALGICTGKACESGVLSFNVTGFSGYAAGMSANLTIYDTSDNISVVQNQTISFYAFYNNGSDPIADAVCSLIYNLSGTLSSEQDMDYNATTGLYNYTTSFPDTGNYSFNVTCNGTGTGFDVVRAQDNFTIDLFADLSPPGISGITSSAVTNQSAWVTWTTNESGTSVIKYGTVSGTYENISSNASLATSHTVILSSLSADTTYYYVVNSTDEDSNSAESEEYNFTTISTNDTLAPVITINYPENGTNLSNETTYVYINISTHETATCKYSDNSSFNFSSDGTGFTVTNSTTHYFNYTGLEANSTYSLYYICNDSEGNTGSPAAYHLFGVSSTEDTIPVYLSSIVNSSITNQSARITWTTNRAATSRVKYGIVSGVYPYIATTSGYSTSHTVNLTSLTSYRLYYYVVNSSDAYGHSNQSSQYSFRTNVTLDTRAPRIVLSITNGSTYSNWHNLTLTATTNEAATCGITAGLYGATAIATTVRMIPSSTTNLTHTKRYNATVDSTGYNNYFTVSCEDAAGNTRTNTSYFKLNDTTAPAITFLDTSPSDASYVNNQSITVKIATFEPVYSGYPLLSWDSATNVSMTSSTPGYRYMKTTFAQGSHTYSVFVKDLKGNLASSTRTVTVDTVAPEITVLKPESTFSDSIGLILNLSTSEDTDCSYELYRSTTEVESGDIDTVVDNATCHSECDDEYEDCFDECDDDTVCEDNCEDTLDDCNSNCDTYPFIRYVVFTGTFRNGDYWFWINCTDLAGNNVTANESFEIQDTTPPRIISIAPNDTTEKGSSVDMEIELSEAGTCRYSHEDVSWENMNGTVTGSSTSLEKEIEGFAAGNHTLYILCQDTAGNKIAKSERIDFTYSPKTTQIEEEPVTISREYKIKKITANEPETLEIKDTDYPVAELTFNANKDLKNVEIELVKYTDTSSITLPTGLVYEVFEIRHTGISNKNINDVTLKFRVEKAWLRTNSVDKSQIALKKFETGWNTLNSTFVTEDTDYVYFQSKSEYLSMFAITAEKSATANITKPDVQRPSNQSSNQTAEPEEGLFSGSLVWIMLLVVLVGGGGSVGVLLYRRSLRHPQQVSAEATPLEGKATAIPFTKKGIASVAKSLKKDDDIGKFIVKELKKRIFLGKEKALEKVKEMLVSVGHRPEDIDAKLIALGFVELPAEEAYEDGTDLRGYIAKCLEAGLSFEEIRDSLLGSGFDEASIDQEFSLYGSGEENVDYMQELEEYFRTSYDSGLSVEDIVQALAEAGNDPATIEELVQRMAPPVDIEDELRAYIKSSLEEGQGIDASREELLSLGHDGETVEKIISEFRDPKHDEILHYVDENLKKGHSREEIRAALLGVGHKPQDIDSILSEVEDIRSDLNDDITQFIQLSINSGKTKEDVRQELLKIGLNDREINARLKGIR